MLVLYFPEGPLKQACFGLTLTNCSLLVFAVPQEGGRTDICLTVPDEPLYDRLT